MPNDITINDPLGFGLRSIPEPLQRLWLIQRGNPYFEGDLRKARERLGLPAEGFSQQAGYVEWLATRMKRHGHDDRLALPIFIRDHRIETGEEFIRSTANPQDTLDDSIAPVPCCRTDPLRIEAQWLEARYGLSEAKLEPGFADLPDDIARHILVGGWATRKSLGDAKRGPRFETAKTDDASRWFVVSRTRETHEGLDSRAGEGHRLTHWYSWWGQRHDGSNIREIADRAYQSREVRKLDESAIRKAISKIESLMAPLPEN